MNHSIIPGLINRAAQILRKPVADASLSEYSILAELLEHRPVRDGLPGYCDTPDDATGLMQWAELLESHRAPAVAVAALRWTAATRCASADDALAMLRKSDAAIHEPTAALVSGARGTGTAQEWGQLIADVNYQSAVQLGEAMAV